MKLWNYRNYKGRRFYRLNHAKMSKSMFFLSYYRILHTAYLKRQRYCIASVKRMFVDTFGLEPDAWSVSYITDTEKCFVNDIITEALNKNGVIVCPECLRQMLIEIGFDVYLIQSVSFDKKPDKNAFYQWLPMKKDRTLKKTVKCFWKERLPKEKLLFNLYYQLEPYKREILSVYRKLLLANDTLLIKADEKEAVLEYINSELPQHTDEPEKIETIKLPEVPEATETPDEPEVPEATETPDEPEVPEVTEASDEPEVTATAEEVVLQPDEARQPKPVLSKASNQPVKRKKQPCPTECRGFREKNQMTRKKAVTCAVCVAAAGALLVPLVAYTVIKQKTS